MMELLRKSEAPSIKHKHVQERAAVQGLPCTPGSAAHAWCAGWLEPILVLQEHMLLLLLLLPLPGWPAGQLTELCRLVVPTDGCWRPEGCRHFTLGGERDWDLRSVGLGGKDVGCAWLWLYFFLPHAQCVAYEKLQGVQLVG